MSKYEKCTEHALVASRGGDGAVLEWSGPFINYLVTNACTRNLCDFGLDHAPDGLSIWSGESYSHHSFDGEVDDGLTKGSFRKLTRYEYALLRKGRRVLGPPLRVTT